MSKGNIHITPKGNSWVAKRERADTPLSTHRTQGAAEIAARPIAKRDGVELVIHRPNGQIRDKDSFGPDPSPPKDKKH